MIEKIEADLKAAMQAGETDKVAVLRLLKSALHNQKINLGHDLSDAEAIAALEKEAKQRKDSIEAYEKANRQDLADPEKAELKVIEDYLPEKMSEGDLSKIIDEVIAETGADSAAQMGQVIGKVREKTAGQADGAMIASLVRQKLNA